MCHVRSAKCGEACLSVLDRTDQGLLARLGALEVCLRPKNRSRELLLIQLDGVDGAAHVGEACGVDDENRREVGLGERGAALAWCHHGGMVDAPMKRARQHACTSGGELCGLGRGLLRAHARCWQRLHCCDLWG